MLSVEAANVGVVDLMRCVVVDVVHGCCVVCSPGVSCLIVNCAEFCVGADVHGVCVFANLLMLFQLADHGGDVGPWRRGGGGCGSGGGVVNVTQRLEGPLPVVLTLLPSPSAVRCRDGVGDRRQWWRRRRRRGAPHRSGGGLAK